MEAEFDAIDKNGGGQILFDEFVEWATAKNLDIEEDDDQTNHFCSCVYFKYSNGEIYKNNVYLLHGKTYRIKFFL